MTEYIPFKVENREAFMTVPLRTLTDRIEESIEGQDEAHLSLQFPSCVEAAHFMEVVEIQTEGGPLHARPIVVIARGIDGYDCGFRYGSNTPPNEIRLDLKRKAE